jgi:hypothetical protein
VQASRLRDESRKSFEALGAKHVQNELVLGYTCQVVFEQRVNLLGRDLSKLLQAAQELEEIKITIELVSKHVMAPRHDRRGELGVLRVEAIIEYPADSRVPVSLVELPVE